MAVSAITECARELSVERVFTFVAIATHMHPKHDPLANENEEGNGTAGVERGRLSFLKGQFATPMSGALTV
jgi:hypothetical protein